MDYSTVGNNNSVIFLNNQVQILDNIFVRAGFISVYSLIFILCLLGNFAVILVVTLKWKGRLLSKFYLGNLATANILVAIFCIPQNLFIHLLDSWMFGEPMCKMFHFVTNLTQAVSMLSLVVVSIERYMVLMHAFKCREVLTLRRIKVGWLLVWLLSAGGSLPRFLYSGLVRAPADDKGTEGEICVPNRSMHNSATTDTVYLIAFYAGPLTVMFVIYLRIGVHIRKCENMRKNLVRNKFHSGFFIQNNNGSRQMGNLGFATSTHCGQMVQVKSATKRVNRRERCSRQVKTIGPQGTEIITRGGRLSRVRGRKRQSLVRMLIFIVITFALLNLPYHVHKFCVNFWPSYEMSSDLTSVILPFTFVLMYVNCALNPILFLWMSSRFRGSLRDLIRKLSVACCRTADCV